MHFKKTADRQNDRITLRHVDWQQWSLKLSACERKEIKYKNWLLPIACRRVDRCCRQSGCVRQIPRPVYTTETAVASYHVLVVRRRPPRRRYHRFTNRSYIIDSRAAGVCDVRPVASFQRRGEAKLHRISLGPSVICPGVPVKERSQVK